MIEYVSRASKCGLPSSIHAIGDKAVHDALDVFATVRREEAERGILAPNRRHRIEHVQIIHPADAGRLAELDVIASMQPIHATSDRITADRYWGERTAYAYNPRLQLSRRRRAFGSDGRGEPFDPSSGYIRSDPRARRSAAGAGARRRGSACMNQCSVSRRDRLMPRAWKIDWGNCVRVSSPI